MAGQPPELPAPSDKARRPRKRATSYDVARLAGVSQSAVSRAFSPGCSVSDDVRQRVKEAAQTLGYRPNAIARGLILQRSNLIGLIVPSLASLYYPEITVELTAQVARHGSRVLLMTADDEAQASFAVEQLAAFRADGVIAATTIGRNAMQDLALHQTPIVFFNRQPAGRSGSAVMVDHQDGEARLVQRLWAGGARRFAVISGPENSEVSRERGRGVERTLQELGSEICGRETGDFRYQSGVEAALRLHAGGTRYDAIVCVNDAMALGAMDALRRHLGFRIPEEVSVTGFDGFGAAHWLSYELTTLLQPLQRMAAAAAAILFERIAAPETPPERRLFQAEIVPGRSARLGVEAEP